MAPKKKKTEPEPEKKLSRGDVDELIDDGTALLDERDWSPALAKLEALALNRNNIGDAGVSAIAEAVAGGALASLK